MTPFSGLHVDLDRIKHDNDKIDGKRKNNCLVSAVEKLTKAQKCELQANNQIKYGLSEEYLRQLVLPPRKRIKLFEDPRKITNARVYLSAVD